MIKEDIMKSFILKYCSQLYNFMLINIHMLSKLSPKAFCDYSWHICLILGASNSNLYPPINVYFTRELS